MVCTFLGITITKTTIFISDPLFSDMTVYYNPANKHAFPISSIENVIRNRTNYATKIAFGKFPQKVIRRIGFKSNGCTGQDLNFGCCLGINFERLNFSREGE